MKTEVYEKEATTTTNRTRSEAQSGYDSSKPDGDKAEMMKKVEAAGKVRSPGAQRPEGNCAK
jgi:hypothetical protein